MEINVGIVDTQIVLKTLVGTQWIFVIALGTTFLHHEMFADRQPQCAGTIEEAVVRTAVSWYQYCHMMLLPVILPLFSELFLLMWLCLC